MIFFKEKITLFGHILQGFGPAVTCVVIIHINLEMFNSVIISILPLKDKVYVNRVIRL